MNFTQFKREIIGFGFKYTQCGTCTRKWDEFVKDDQKVKIPSRYYLSTAEVYEEEELIAQNFDNYQELFDYLKE